MTAENVTELQTGPAPLDKAALLAASASMQFETDDVNIPGFGLQKIRALSRAEQQKAVGLYNSHPTVTEAEAWMMATACVEPTWTVVEVKKLQNGPLGRHISAVIDAISDLSGMGGDDVGPEATKQFPE